MPWLKYPLQFAAGLLLAAGFTGCGKPDQPPIATPTPDSSLAANAATSHVVPRRTQPLVITNRVIIEDRRTGPAAVDSNANNTAPVVTCSAPAVPPCNPSDGTPVTLSARVEDVDGNALSVVWNIDGRDRYTQQVAAGGPPTSADVTFSYTMTPGDHVVKVTALDGSLLASCDVTVSLRGDTQEPLVSCPRDIAVPVDPAHCTAIVAFSPKVTDNCPDTSFVCEPASGSAFPIGVTTVTCTATDAAGNVAACSFNVAVQVVNRCPQNDGHWRMNLGAWPITSLQIGNQVYTRSQLTPILRATVPADASMVLARQLIVAALNTAAGSDPRPICGVLDRANAVLGGFAGKLPYRVSTTSAVGRSMVELANRLNGYNSGTMTPECVP